MSIDEFLDKLEDVRPVGNGYEAICPAHEDQAPSLGVAEGDNGILLTCRAGCKTEDVVRALGLQMRDLFPTKKTSGEPEAIYTYEDEEGNELFQSVRFPGKKFRYRHFDPFQPATDGEAWVWSMDGVRRVLYRLPQVLTAVREGKTIYITEGEKDADALDALGKTATCNPMGAGKWRPEYADFLHGAKTVIIVADRDEPGRNHAEKVKESLLGRVESLWVVQAKEGKDAHDHLAAGHAVSDFVPVREKRVRRGIVTARELSEQAIEDLSLTADDIPGYVFTPEVPITFRQGRMYAVGAYTGDGKTCYAQQGARALAMDNKRGGYWSLEMPERDLRNRFLTHKGIPLSLLEEPWRLRMDALMYQAYLDGCEEIANWNLDIIFDSSTTAEKIAEISRDREHEFIVIDHVHRFAWGERRKFEEQIVALTNIALEQNVMLLVLCQLRKSTRGKDFDAYPMPSLQDFRETSQIADDASMALAIWRQRDGAGLAYTGNTQVIVLKNRHTTGGSDAAGRIFMPYFDPTRQMFLPAPLGGVS